MRLKMSQFNPEVNYHHGQYQRLINQVNRCARYHGAHYRGAHHHAAKVCHGIDRYVPTCATGGEIAPLTSHVSAVLNVKWRRLIQ